METEMRKLTEIKKDLIKNIRKTGHIIDNSRLEGCLETNNALKILGMIQGFEPNSISANELAQLYAGLNYSIATNQYKPRDDATIKTLMDNIVEYGHKKGEHIENIAYGLSQNSATPITKRNIQYTW